jgi:hypothetical protein
VNENTYNEMNKAADNLTNAGMCGGAKQQKQKKAKKPKDCGCGKPVKFGGNGSILDRVFDGFANNFSEQFVDRSHVISSLPAPAVGGRKAPKKHVKKGGDFKNMSEYMGSVSDRYGKVNVYNRKSGGFKNVGLDYNSGIKTNDFKGANTSRDVSTSVLEVLSNASVTNASIASMNKAVEYGSYANANMKTAFNFGGVDGGSAKKDKKPKRKSLSNSKPKPKPKPKSNKKSKDI